MFQPCSWRIKRYEKFDYMRPNELTIKQAHEGLMQKQFSAGELATACIEAVKKNNTELNALITLVSEEEILAQAKSIDERISRNEKLSSLAGIPFTVKDTICSKGIRSTGAAKILDNYIPPYTATTINRIQQHGGIILGKTNCDAFGHGASNENSHYGPVKNPHDKSRVAGGSSGGSGAAVASHMGIFSVAEDTGGSVRCPAAFCGVVGLKVSYGRNSRYGVMPMASSLDTIGPIGKSVFDVAVIEEVMAGVDPFDSTTVPRHVPRYTEMLEMDISTLKAGIPEEYFGSGVQEEVRVAVSAAIQKLEKLGVQIVPVSLPMTKYAVATYYIIVPAEDSSNLARLDGIRYGVRNSDAKNIFETYAFSRRDGFPDEVKRRIMIGTYTLSAGYYDAYYLKAQKVRTLIVEDFERVFREVNFLVTPTQPNTAFKIGANVKDPLTMYLQDVFVGPASVAGIPALSLPVGKDSQGLPIGLQIIGPSFQEELVLNVGHKLEQEIQYKNLKIPKS